MAILLVMKPTQQWYVKGTVINSAAGMNSYRRVSLLAAAMALVAGIVFYVGYDSARKRIRHLQEGEYSHGDYPSASKYRTSTSSGYTPPKSAEEAVAGALANVKRRYRQNLSRFGLTESYYDETGGICDLMLLDVNSWTKYQIVYYRASNQLEWPRTMPKDTAELLIHDRMLMDTYEKALGK